jgi:RNA polymerase sigma-70 factor (sigma-E family)
VTDAAAPALGIDGGESVVRGRAAMLDAARRLRARRSRPAEQAATAAAASTTDSTTFDDVFHREYVPMVRLATLLLGNEDEAEEAVQDALAVVHERWGSLTRPGGYLRQCVVNRCSDILRHREVVRRLRRRAVDQVEPAQLGADHLVDALATLPAKRRAAVVLRYYEGCSEAEIAEVLGVRPGTVKSMLHRALAQLREVVEP